MKATPRAARYRPATDSTAWSGTTKSRARRIPPAKLFRQYDPRTGRWWSVDPEAARFPGVSPYAAFNNNPALYVDPLGDEYYVSDEGKMLDHEINNPNDPTVFMISGDNGIKGQSEKKKG